MFTAQNPSFSALVPLADASLLIRSHLSEAAAVLAEFMSAPANIEAIALAASVMVDSFAQGGKVIACGNGGSHCDAMHFAEELTGRFRNDRAPLPAIAISDPSHLSCVANDYGFDQVFSRFVQALGQPQDVLLGISTSGNSANVIKALEMAKAKGMKVVLLTGKDGGQLGQAGADVEIRVPHLGFADRVQEVHIKVIHLIIALIEKALIAKS